MCLAIAPNRQRSNSLLARTWRQITMTPLRLFSFGAAFHVLLCSSIVASSLLLDIPLNTHALLSALLFGVAALLVFGFLMARLPESYGLSPVHFGRYNTVYMFIFSALLMLEAGALLDDIFVITGLLLLLPGWLIAIQSIKDIHDWLPSKSQTVSSVIVMLLVSVFFGLVISVLTNFFGTYTNIETVINVMTTVALLMIIPAFQILLIKAPDNVRVVSI